MPALDEFGFMKEIRNNLKTESLPVIMLTASTDLEIRESTFRMGADDFVSKSVFSNDFIPRVKKFISDRPGIPFPPYELNRVRFSLRDFIDKWRVRNYIYSSMWKEISVRRFLVF